MSAQYSAFNSLEFVAQNDENMTVKGKNLHRQTNPDSKYSLISTSVISSS